MKELTPSIPALAVSVTRCPTAYVAPSTGQISAAHTTALREHNNAIDKAREAKGGPPPITFGKRGKTHRPLFVPQTVTAFHENVPDIADDLPDGYAVNV